jgi:two-component system, NarL family, invasion response regulator UvrY
MSTSDGIQMSSTSASGSDQETTVGVMVVDDQESFRRAARAVIDATPGFAPLRDAASGLEALEFAQDLQPDLVLMDANMPGMDGFETARRLTAAHPKSVVVLVSIEDQDGLPGTVTSCGAVAFLHKRELRPATLRALWTLYGPTD